MDNQPAADAESVDMSKPGLDASGVKTIVTSPWRTALSRSGAARVPFSPYQMQRCERPSISQDEDGPRVQTTTTEVSMKQTNAKKQTYWVGIDWGKAQHTVAVADDRRAVVEQFTAPATLEGLARLHETLQALGPVEGVAIEATHNPVLYSLVQKGYTVYPINPKLSKNWREGSSVAGGKSDPRDGRVLATELARRHEELRPRRDADPATSELRGLCEKQRALIDQRTALVQRLRETVSVYYPAALEFFSDLTAPTAWAFLKRFPNPQQLAGARQDTLIRFLRAHQIGLKPVWLERIARRHEAAAWPTPPAALAEEGLALACVAQLQALQAHIDRFSRLIAERTKELPETPLVGSLPGAGERLTPELTALVRSGDVPASGVAGLRCTAGVAPVEDQSGKHRGTRMRRRCNKHARNTLHLFAWCSTRCCQWAKAFYDLCKERGDTHATALRKLADKWLRILNAILRTGRPYDEARHLENLRAAHSPVYARLCEQHRG